MATNMNNEDKLLSPEQVADILGVKKNTLAVWRSTGRYPLPFKRIGRRIRYLQSEVQHFLDVSSFSSTGDYGC